MPDTFFLILEEKRIRDFVMCFYKIIDESSQDKRIIVGFEILTLKMFVLNQKLPLCWALQGADPSEGAEPLPTHPQDHDILLSIYYSLYE